METIVLPDGVQTIGADAFFGCGALTSVEIPASVDTIGDRAFRFCAPELTLRVAAGSFVEEYARENGIRFETR